MLSEEAWYYMPQGHLLRLDNMASEEISMGVEQQMDSDLAKILEEANVLQAGSMSAVHAASEAGERSLLTLFDDGALAKRVTKTKKDKDAGEEGVEMQPKTVRESLECIAKLE